MGFLNKKIISFNDKFFGLDLSDFSVKTLELEKSGEALKIRSFSYVIIDKGCIEDGKIINKQRTCEAIKKAIGKSGPKKINTRKVFCSLPESKAFLRIISIPKISEAEAQEAIKWEIEASIPLTCDQVYFDWQFLGEREGKLDVLTIAVSREIVDDYMEVLKLAGLEVYGLEAESVANVRSLIPKDSNQEEACLIIDLGVQKATFIIAENSVPYFTSSIPFSCEEITDVIAKSLNVSHEEADKIRIFQGIEHSLETDSVFNLIKPFLENLSVEVEKTIDFYQSISKRRKGIKKIIICNGGANLRGLLPYLTARLRREIVVGDPWVNLNLGNNLPKMSKESSVYFATAAGLAMRED